MQLFRREVNYLGRIVSANGYCVGPSNTHALLSLKNTETRIVGNVRKVLGELGYYRKDVYIQDFSRIAQLLFELLKTLGVKSRSPMNVTRKRVQRDSVFIYGTREVGTKPIWTSTGSEISTPSDLDLIYLR